MEYLGHKTEDGRIQLLLDHLQGTARLCSEFVSDFAPAELGNILGMYHDVGKYSPGFQHRIKDNGPKVDHSTAGAQETKTFQPFPFCIAGHHSGLMNMGTQISQDDGSLWTRMKKELSGNLDYSAYKEEVDIKPNVCLENLNRAFYSNFFSAMFFTRMLFSCLVDADFLDTEYFMSDGKIKRGGFSGIDELYKKFMDYVSSANFYPPKNEINRKRSEIRDRCLLVAQEKPGLYSLTVPTGGGKTLSSMGFALQHAVTHHKKRIIYVIPYTSIIEQTAEVFGNIFGSENVVQHHINVEYNDSDSNSVDERKKLATENWDAPIIITTNVQFFESLYAKKTSRCRKLHNIVDSVVIFDEAQMIPNDYLLPCVKTIEELVKNYKVTAVMCTATQPSLNKFYDGLECREIYPDVQGLYDFFRRVRYQYIDMENLEQLGEKLNSHHQVLCITNSKKDAQQIFSLLEGESGTYHLSTFMYPEHRKRILKQIREDLKAGKKCRVVATSLIEAGVDVDFPVVYRETAGIDNVIQAGGRCNREGKNDKDKSIVYVYDLHKKGRAIPNFIKLPSSVAQSIWRDFSDPSSTEAIKAYFDQLHNVKGESLDKKGILKNIDSKAMKFADIAKDFRIIEEDEHAVFIPEGEEAQEIFEFLRRGVRNRNLLRKAGKYMVNLYDKQYNQLAGMGKLEELDLSISVLTDLSVYEKRIGLNIPMEEGLGLFV